MDKRHRKSDRYSITCELTKEERRAFKAKLGATGRKVGHVVHQLITGWVKDTKQTA